MKKNSGQNFDKKKVSSYFDFLFRQVSEVFKQIYGPVLDNDL